MADLNRVPAPLACRSPNAPQDGARLTGAPLALKLVHTFRCSAKAVAATCGYRVVEPPWNGSPGTATLDVLQEEAMTDAEFVLMHDPHEHAELNKSSTACCGTPHSSHLGDLSDTGTMQSWRLSSTPTYDDAAVSSRQETNGFVCAEATPTSSSRSYRVEYWKGPPPGALFMGNECTPVQQGKR